MRIEELKNKILYKVTMKIFLYSSNLAAFIGRNHYTPASRIFNQLYEKYFPEQLKKMGLIDKVVSANIGDKGIIMDISKKLEGNTDLKEKLDKICQGNLSSKKMKTDKDGLVSVIMDNKTLTKDEKETLKTAMDGYTSKKFGTIREVNALDIYRKIYKNEKIITGIDSKSKKVFRDGDIELWLISKVDAMNDERVVIEIKNRMYKLFNEVREYEWLQVQTYLDVYDLDRALLVEYLNDSGAADEADNMKVNKIERDRKFWDEVVLAELWQYFSVLLKIIMNVDLMTEYMSLSENEQNEFIKKMIRDR